MHRRDALTEVLTQAIIRYAVERVRLDPPPLDGPRPEAELRAMVGHTVTPEGIGGLEALRVFADVLAPACISIDHPRYFSFVPTAPTEAAILFDLVVGASSIYGGSWLEGAGAVFAENEALSWLAEVAGLPPSAGGVFVAGGSAGNLCGLVAARHAWRAQPGHPDRARQRALILASSGAHSSIVAAASVMDADVVALPADERGRLTGEATAAAWSRLPEADRARAVAVVGTAGTTNAGIVDDLAGIGAAARRPWAVVPRRRRVRRRRARGAERARPVRGHRAGRQPRRRPPQVAVRAVRLRGRSSTGIRPSHGPTFTQHAEYLETLTERPEWNPSDYAYHLTRRARGLPFWFSLATHGTRAYADAVEATLRLTQEAAQLIRDEPPRRAGPRTRAVGDRVPPAGLAAGRVPAVERRGPRVGPDAHRADQLARGDRAAVLLRQPPHRAR